MNDLRKGTIIIGERKENVLLKKHTVYGRSLKASPGVYGYSTNKTFAKEYHRGVISLYNFAGLCPSSEVFIPVSST